jgi:hypothetical protein
LSSLFRARRTSGPRKLDTAAAIDVVALLALLRHPRSYDCLVTLIDVRNVFVAAKAASVFESVRYRAAFTPLMSIVQGQLSFASAPALAALHLNAPPSSMPAIIAGCARSGLIEAEPELLSQVLLAISTGDAMHWSHGHISSAVPGERLLAYEILRTARADPADAF